MIVGIVLFALGIVLSIVLHEYGHMRVALWSGMRVRRFFVGFGPTLWSTHRGGIEYGAKAIPLGGFCDIAGMTAYDELDPADEPRAMWRQAWWKRVAVLLAGPVMNFALAFVLFYIVAVGWGLPNRDREPIPTESVPAVVGATCDTQGTCAPGAGPAGAAGLRAGDRVTALAGQPVRSWADLGALARPRAGQAVPVVVDRAGHPVSTTVTISSTPDGRGGSRGALGVQLDDAAVPQEVRDDPRHAARLHYDPLAAVPATVGFSGQMVRATLDGLVAFPGKIPGVAKSIVGGERAEDSPISVVGASHVGGQIAERGWWDTFLVMLAGLNLFIGAFNLVPLTPFDGGHIAVVFYERLRDVLRRMRGLGPGGPADYARLAPVTMTVFVVLVGVSAVVIVADLVNPIVVP